jgi:hypothetical protein
VSPDIAPEPDLRILILRNNHFDEGLKKDYVPFSGTYRRAKLRKRRQAGFAVAGGIRSRVRASGEENT